MRRPTLSALLLVLLAATAPVAAERPERIQDWAWQKLTECGSAEVLVVLDAKADLAAASAGIADRVERRRAVIAALRATAEASQAELIRRLDQRRVAYRSFHVVNALLVTADPALAAELAARPEVNRIVGNPRLALAEPEPATEPDPVLTLNAAIPWGVDRINAPVLWGLGFDGTGITIGGQDTGVRWIHEAVKDHYRGWDGVAADHDYNWHDAIHANAGTNPCGADAVAPCDDHGHGTHTVGTAAGGSATEAVGVAPGARWIACRNMDDGYGTPATYLECFEFFLAPWPVGKGPAQGDPTLAPDVTVNSWTCPPSEGCAWDVLEAAVVAQRAAAIFTEVSAGNSGPGCGSVSSPPAIYGSAFTIGASNSSDRLAGFSSRGPAANTGEMKPDVCAPGVSVRSATAAADDSYDSWNGTSMAGPHVAGAVALLWSAEPALRGDIARTEELLARTARPLRANIETCGGEYAFGPNNSWGRGVIDVAQALAAVNLPAIETLCSNGADDDGDRFVDCADLDCAGAANCPEAGNCADRVDNDLDGRTDCADVDCIADPLCPERGNCTDGVDNDGDSATDCQDRDCDRDLACPGLARSATLDTSSGFPVPALSTLFEPTCLDPAWSLCAATVAPGPLPGRMIGEATTPATPELRLYQHSDGAPMGLAKSGDDLIYQAN